MALPRRFSWTLYEASARWGCMPADIIGWAISGHIEISAAIPTVTTSQGEFSGIAVLPPEDFVRMFRRDGSGPRSSTVHRIRRAGQGEDWQRIHEPERGVEFEQPDLLITDEELQRFEEDHELAPRAKNYTGGAPRWDWEGFYTALIRRIHEHGLPEQQKDLVQEMLGWFERRSDTGDAPDISTIRKKIAAVWRELREG